MGSRSAVRNLCCEALGQVSALKDYISNKFEDYSY
jgi:hypothetical protein